ncbi:MAG: hypothetical protein ACOY82_10430 [Pseudomonadota bacterium]
MSGAPPVSARAIDRDSDPIARTRSFIETYRSVGLPDLRELEALRTILGRAFHRSLLEASVESGISSLRYPNDKPPHVEFSFICSDGSYDDYEVAPERFVGPMVADVVVSFLDRYDGGTYRWKDRYRWVREGGDWRLADIQCEIDDPQRSYSLRASTGH